MKFVIKHQIKGRIRVHLVQNKMSLKQADIVQYYLESLDFVTKAKVYEQTSDIAIEYNGKTEKDYKNVDAISGATITSTGYSTAISKVFEAVKILEGEAK